MNDTVETAEVVAETVTTEAPEEKKESKKQPEKVEDSPIHYFENAKVVCACGNTFTTGSTKEEIRVEICSNCHPFYTGQEKFVDTEGRVERFQRLTEAKKEPKAKKETEKKPERPRTLRDMLAAIDDNK